MAICLRSSGSPEQSRLEFQAPAWPKHLGWWKQSICKPGRPAAWMSSLSFFQKAGTSEI
jgi:hypothetical protein